MTNCIHYECLLNMKRSLILIIYSLNFVCFYKIIMRLLSASALNIKNVKRIKFNSNNIFLFDYLKYVEINR